MSGRAARTAAVIAVAIALGVVALAVAGRGGCPDEGYPGSPDCVAYAYAARTDASKCDLVSPALLERLTGARGPEARRLCARTLRAAKPPEKVEVIERETVGEQVVVELLTDGREGKLTLAPSRGRWQIVSFDE